MRLTWHRAAGGVPVFLQELSGVAATLLGLLVIVGWQTGTATLTSMAPGSAPMQYFTAVAFTLSGVGLLLAVSERGPLSGMAGLLTASIGLVSLAQDLLGVSPGTDFVFGALPFLISAHELPSRMPPNAALAIARMGNGYVATLVEATLLGGVTRVNGQRLQGRRGLEHGDQLQVGGLTLEFRCK